MGRFPSEYMGALVQGQALGGIIAVGTNVVMLAMGLDDVRYLRHVFIFCICNCKNFKLLILVLPFMTSWLLSFI